MVEIFIDDEFYSEEEAKVSVYDHGLLYGDGVFEGIRAYNGVIFKLEDHVDRLFDSALAINLDVPYTKSEIIDKIIEVLRRNELEDAYIRPILTRGNGNLGLDPNKCGETKLIIIVQEWEPMYGDLYSEGLDAVTVGTRRNSIDALPPNIKSLNYLNNILAKIEANAKGADEAIFLDNEGKVSEGSGDNIFVVKDEKVKTPPTLNNLKGITRSTVFEIAEDLNIDIETTNLGLFDLYTADEVFVSGTAAEIAPITQIDGRTIGNGDPGQMTKKLMDKFKELTGEKGKPIH
ncbi:MAG: Branched-chain amino acid aminotransferase/4-amino-4-deoxychorismate lyase IlvE [Candidatus Methanohalarchaeum thermophilum]|uniref:Branched-chain-amino-acid aminotransferase n=1 Tax=Methanohalarchaeum thermophilum TaxID=1903181 RepID=A0A1Q6DV60_METT1|nr:MAG: Branched-chain amino acid aminotransferase/4-amino-4-deoxychorismate lyase IlvE [Candidatus Methanohalarchaeum thermophilum]